MVIENTGGVNTRLGTIYVQNTNNKVNNNAISCAWQTSLSAVSSEEELQQTELEENETYEEKLARLTTEKQTAEQELQTAQQNANESLGNVVDAVSSYCSVAYSVSIEGMDEQTIMQTYSYVESLEGIGKVYVQYYDNTIVGYSSTTDNPENQAKYDEIIQNDAKAMKMLDAAWGKYYAAQEAYDQFINTDENITSL